jgi:hypothetical protein
MKSSDDIKLNTTTIGIGNNIIKIIIEPNDINKIPSYFPKIDTDWSNNSDPEKDIMEAFNLILDSDEIRNK